MGVAAEIVVISGCGVHAHERTKSGKQKKKEKKKETSELCGSPRCLGLYHFFAQPIRSLKGQGGSKNKFLCWLYATVNSLARVRAERAYIIRRDALFFLFRFFFKSFRNAREPVRYTNARLRTSYLTDTAG